MNEEDYFDYLVSIGAMRPEEARLSRQQQQVDMLRGNSMQSPEGRMAGNTYVAPSITQYAAQLANAYGSRKGQEQLDTKYGEFNAKQKAMLDALRSKRQMSSAPQPMSPLDEEEEKRRREAAAGYALVSG